MRRKVLMTVGLPGAGKTFWARCYQAGHPGTVLVCKDDLRAMFHDGKHSKGRESFVLKARDLIVCQALDDGHDIIVCDTNFHAKHRERMEQIAAQHGAIVEIKDFTGVPLEICIERDLQRPNSVGERVIRQMHRQYIETKIASPAWDASLPTAIICDIDGTLALFDRSRVSPYDRDFSKDEVNYAVRDVLRVNSGRGCSLVIFSGRKEKHRAVTEEWLKNNGVYYDVLYMRRDEDNRKDVEIKEELYNQHIRGKSNVHMVIDDRLQVCRLWHRLGLPLFRVGDPDADF